MQPQIRRVGIGLVVAFLAVFLQLNYVQIIAAERIAGNNANVRSLLQEYAIKRGDIVTVDGQRVAFSQPTGGRLRHRRIYPGGELYGHITGFYSILYGTTRVEDSFNDQLLGTSGVITMQDIQDRFLGSGEKGDDVRLTVHSQLQETARAALGANEGAVVALDPRSGDIKAMWSNPSYDPTPLASHEGDAAKEYYNSLDPKSQDSPLVPRSTLRSYPPGSTFKIVTAAAALESGRYTPTSVFPDPQALDLPQTTDDLTNFTNTACTSAGQIDLATAITISCDTTFADLGLKIYPQLTETSEGFGFNEPIPFDIASEPSNFPEVPDDQLPLRAFAGIGQGDVAATPLQMALVAAAVANDGDVPRPRLVREVISPSGGIVDRFPPETIGSPMSPETADQLTDMMVSVVADPEGTGTAAALGDVAVAGKTGTAQTVEGANPHTWFICFAPADDPQIAVAVIVENGGTFGSEATGGAVAAPIARQVMEADREISGW
ncbi:MAG: penicillin-binding protein 2 [Actinobacteria bacterium]|nr:penicillin-binding protein 2 [Actinomycetota bacterium]